MKGLLLNQYYAVEKTIWWYIPLSLVLATGLVFFDHPIVQRLAAFIPLILLGGAALEVLKQEAKSGWSQYVLTLPIKRTWVVQSHYLFFFLLVLVGIVIGLVAYLIAQLIFGIGLSNGYIHGLMTVLGLVFTLGFVSYPLTYILGTEKAEVISYIGVGAGLGMYVLIGALFTFLPLNNVPFINPDILFPVSFLAINFILFIISYIISVQVYKRKEF
ncbi:ABC-2 transporter permease [Alkalicoccobacillus porphyridii]|uniref:ABC-2 transporter permease n=1 Tax=Alkalicoccobacillus porphyridii TaxID=2597270 RepID=A0A554A2I1_9BACI|nr:ABC-2 transporter permease [Alkalicoccobacillus porphyridii]TSB47899.1 ABC-2 transporter permease [Alkalicoccobacillus porphyridii]